MPVEKNVELPITERGSDGSKKRRLSNDEEIQRHYKKLSTEKKPGARFLMSQETGTIYDKNIERKRTVELNSEKFWSFYNS